MTPPDRPQPEIPFLERMLSRFHELVPDVPVVIVGQEPPPTAIGLNPAQVSQQTAAAMAESTALLRQLWPVATGGLPMPATADTSWRQESGYTSSVLAVARARHWGAVPGAAARIAGAGQVLGEQGWDTVRRDQGRAGCLRLLARRGPTLAEVTIWTRPDAYDLQVQHGPVLVGATGTGLIAAGSRTVELGADRR